MKTLLHRAKKEKLTIFFFPQTTCLTSPVAVPEPEPLLLQNVLYSLLIPLTPLICELIDLLNGLLGLLRSLIFDFLLNYVLGDLIMGGAKPYDSIFTLFPI